MSASSLELNHRRQRLLVTIASYGRKNDIFLRRIIEKYRGMAMEIDVVVLSEAPKDLGNDVRVVVGLPSKNPWSLPFGHKKIFAENVERYDLFAYSEDDMEVTEQNIKAFLRVTPLLQADEIAGFLRYEVDQSGSWHVPEAHATAHWKLETVKQRGAYTVAEFSNEHAGFYILAQSQLKQVIASGNFMRGPYESRYGLPETAATDPYTCCGFRKVICISALEDFLIHHLPNLYIGKLGTPLAGIKQQARTLMNICNGAHPASALCAVEPKVLQRIFHKSYYERPSEEVLKMIPEDAKNILSIGCGCGATELWLKQRGAQVTAIPLDSVIGEVAAKLGIEIVHGTLDASVQQLGERKFDCVLTSNLLHLHPQPAHMLEQFARFVHDGGAMVIASPNFGRIPIVLKRFFGVGDFKKLRNFSSSGINPFGVKFAKRRLKQLGFSNVTARWFDSNQPQKHLAVRRALERFIARDWVMLARR